MRCVLIAAIAGCTALFGCGETDPGWAWDVTLTARNDDCNDPPVPYQETLEYVLSFDEDLAILAQDGVRFATGTSALCTLDYASLTWVEEREGHRVEWMLRGSALHRQGGTSCNLPPDLDWRGTETILILDSEHPDLAPGCRFTMDAEGVYLGER